MPLALVTVPNRDVLNALGLVNPCPNPDKGFTVRYYTNDGDSDNVVSLSHAVKADNVYLLDDSNVTLEQLFLDGPTEDGDMANKSQRDELVGYGLVDRQEGWQWLTAKGTRACVLLGFNEAKGVRDRRRNSQLRDGSLAQQRLQELVNSGDDLLKTVADHNALPLEASERRLDISGDTVLAFTRSIADAKRQLVSE